jgi:phosphatidate cytidylyltransferase
MTRAISGAVLFLLAVALVWFSTRLVFFVAAQLLLVLALMELVGLARSAGLAVPVLPAGAAAVLTCAAFALASVPIDFVLMSAFVAIGAVTLARWRGDRDALSLASATLFPSFYLGLPLGAMIAVRQLRGPAALFLLMFTIIASDTAQYYAGRAFGRRRLAPSISPGKTVEGAVGGVVFGALTLAVAGNWWLAEVPLYIRALLGVGLAAAGIVGDLFESMLKRSGGVKDSASLIPGHGGVLDRIDALLFAAPVYYVVLKYV